jgi:hypothetical protein
MPEPITVEGVQSLVKTLRALGVDMQDLKAAHERTGQYVGAEGAQRAPRRSGMLAASWRPGASATQALVRFGGASIPYANAVHWGTGPRPGRRGPHNIRASLFALKAMQETQPTWLPYYNDELAAMVAKVKGTSA